MVSVVCPDVKTMRRWVEGVREGWSRTMVWERKRKSEMNQDNKLKEKLSQGREKRGCVRWEGVKKRRNT